MKNQLILTIIALALALSSAGQKTEKLYLSGTGNNDTKTWDFYCTAGQNAGKWSTIQVPSCWELQGFGKYDYGYAKDSIRGKEQGLYKYTFQVPAGWKGKEIDLVFEGSMTDTKVLINGREAGPVHQGSFYAFRFDISGLLKYGGNNLLEATVSKHSSNESVNAAERKADFWIFGGIFRPVYLEVLPPVNIAGIAIAANADGQFTGNVSLKGEADKVAVQLFTSDGKKFGAPLIKNIVKGSWNAVLSQKYTKPLLWSPEYPNLYNAEITLYKDGKRTEFM
jgi:beta-galactosidase/beta-glucuronidase